ncbi:hypothetical protein GGU45_003992 [Niabella hirudinis]
MGIQQPEAPESFGLKYFYKPKSLAMKLAISILLLLLSAALLFG